MQRKEQLTRDNAVMGGRVYIQEFDAYATIILLNYLFVGFRTDKPTNVGGTDYVGQFTFSGILVDPVSSTNPLDVYVVPPVSYVEEKHLHYGTRIRLDNKAGKIACVGDWFVVLKFDNGDDSVLVRKDGKLHYRQNKNSTLPGKVALVELVK